MIPFHLQKYVVEQDYSRYTPVDQAVWRYIMRQLHSFLSRHAHPIYNEGLKKTGIEVERIPDIQNMNQHLRKFGWQAVPVSGFIPPAAFMELQSLGLLPIASDMRTISHLMYTPAPDIVHEAAGHAPILVDAAFAGYLKEYAQVARRAIINKHDLDQYGAIRILSDLKEDPTSTTEQISTAEQELDRVTKGITEISEAAILGRMNWWTAEYGLIGTLENPKIFGAGLLSSYGEARHCLSDKVKKIPFSLDCINYAYDITEPQPQLFVTPSFAHLGEVLGQLAETMAYKTGGLSGLQKAKAAETVNTVELDSGLQISGQLSGFKQDGAVFYLQFTGPTQLCENGQQLSGHGIATHAQGFGTPLGRLRGRAQALSDLRDDQMGLEKGRPTTLEFLSGVQVKGTVTGWRRGSNGKLLLISFENCTVSRGSEILFSPDWGSFDMGVGETVRSVFGGAADRENFGQTEDFVAKKIPSRTSSSSETQLHKLYQSVRQFRECSQAEGLVQILKQVEESFPQAWLLQLEIYEIATAQKANWASRVSDNLSKLAQAHPEFREQIEDGLRLVNMP